MNQIQTMAAETLPATINIAFQGTAQAFQDSLRGLGLVLAMAIVVISSCSVSCMKASRTR